jgi:cold shock CspA family protein
VARGRVLQFDQARGYGFVAADDGGEDVFLHSSVFDGDPDVLAPGVKVGFQVMAGDRGRKAYAAYLIADERDPAEETLSSSKPALQTHVVSAPELIAHEPDDDQMCDVLSQSEFTRELTELLLRTSSALTSVQILEMRQEILMFAQKHGWVDG